MRSHFMMTWLICRRCGILLHLSLVSAIVLVPPANAALRHKYTFDGLNIGVGGAFPDLIGNADGVLSGNATISGGKLILPGGGNGINGDHARLLANGPDGVNIATYTSATISLWATLNDANPDDWEHYFSFGYQNPAGTSAGSSIYLTSDAASTTGLRFGIANVGPDAPGFSNEQNLNTTTVPSQSVHHIAVTYDGANNIGHMYLNGNLVATNNSMSHTLAALDFPAVPGPDRPDLAVLGASLYNMDQSFEGAISQFEIYDTPLTASQVASLYHADATCVHPCSAKYLTINRNDGTMTLENVNITLTNVVSYSITSPNGGLDAAHWQTIADNFDATSGGEFDWDEEWIVLSAAGSKTDFRESVAGENGMGGFFSGAFDVPIGAPGAWRKSIYHDVQAEMELADGTVVPLSVRYTGNNNLPFLRSDLNFDGELTIDDWAVFLANSPTNFTGMSPAESYAFGDLNGDLINNLADFRLFKADYIAANQSAGAILDGFELSLSAVPEPSSLALLLITACLSCSRRPRRG